MQRILGKKNQLSLLPLLLSLGLAACGSTSTPAESPAGVASEEATDGAEPASPSAEQESAEEKKSSDDPEFALNDSETAGAAHGATESKIKPTKTEAAMKFVVIDKASDQPVPGIVVKLTSKGGQQYYTEETDATGYAEVLVPVGEKYDLEYLSLGKRSVTAKVPVADEPNQNIKLTLRYKGWVAPPPAEKGKGSSGSGGLNSTSPPGFVLDGVHFDTNKATIRPESFPRLDSVVEFMQHKKSARIEISGHTDNRGNPKANQTLSQDRARSCREYLIEKGIDGSRIVAKGFGDSQPVASNETEEGRQKNRRIEAKEIVE